MFIGGCENLTGLTTVSNPALDCYSLAESRSGPCRLLLWGENMLVIHPDECIDCGVCEPECPVDAIRPDIEPGLEKWLSLNAEYAKAWPNITVKKAPPPDSKEWEGKPDKLQYFSPNPGEGD
jgi:ferredoxin